MILAACSLGPDRTDPSELTSTPARTAEQCYAGDLQACDDLAAVAEGVSDRRTYGRSCGGRVEASAEPCGARFGEIAPLSAGPIPPPTSELEAIAEDCEDGEMTACNLLTSAVGPGSAMAPFADTCGGRDDGAGDCVGRLAVLLPPPLALNIRAAMGESDTNAEQCQMGLLSACDALQNSPNPALKLYGERCGGRSGPIASCVGEFEGAETPPPVPLMVAREPAPALAVDCHAGELGACDELTRSSDQALEVYGETCGGRGGATFDCYQEYLSLLGSPDDASDIIDAEAGGPEPTGVSLPRVRHERL